MEKSVNQKKSQVIINVNYHYSDNSRRPKLMEYHTSFYTIIYKKYLNKSNNISFFRFFAKKIEGH